MKRRQIARVIGLTLLGATPNTSVARLLSSLVDHVDRASRKKRTAMICTGGSYKAAEIVSGLNRNSGRLNTSGKKCLFVFENYPDCEVFIGSAGQIPVEMLRGARHLEWVEKDIRDVDRVIVMGSLRGSMFTLLLNILKAIERTEVISSVILLVPHSSWPFAKSDINSVKIDRRLSIIEKHTQKVYCVSEGVAEEAADCIRKIPPDTPLVEVTKYGSNPFIELYRKIDREMLAATLEAIG